MKHLCPAILSFLLFSCCSPWHFFPTARPEITIPQDTPIVITEHPDTWLWYPTEEERAMLQQWWGNTRNIGVREFWPNAPGSIEIDAHPGLTIHFPPYSDKYIDFSYNGYLHLRQTTEADRRLRQYILNIMQSRKALSESAAEEWENYSSTRHRHYNFTQWQKKHPSAR